MFPVHVAMSSLHESRSRHLQTLSHAVHPSVAQKDENVTVPEQDYTGDGGSTVQPNLAIVSWVCNLCQHRRHFHRLLQRRCLSDDRVLTHMRNKHQRYLSVFTLLSLFWNEKKKCGALLSEQPSYSSIAEIKRKSGAIPLLHLYALWQG